MPQVHVNGVSINYQIDNEGAAKDTIVLINGLADDLEYWAPQVPAFVAAGHRVLRFDNRGIGKSDKPAGPYTSRMLADDAKALVDSLGLRDFHLLGVSMGGMIAEEYAIAYEHDLKSLTLACTYGKADSFCQTMFAMWADLARGLGVPFVMRDVALWAFTGPFFEDRPTEAAEMAAALAAFDMPLDPYLAQLAVIQQHDALGRLAGLTVPTLVLAGEEDILIPVRLSRRLQAAIPRSRWATVTGGHACVQEHPDPFNTAFLDFVAGVGR